LPGQILGKICFPLIYPSFTTQLVQPYVCECSASLSAVKLLQQQKPDGAWS